jgi:hypothetical protein
LSVSGIDRLLNSISLSEVDEELWSSLCSRLRLPVQRRLDLIFPLHWRACRFPFESSRPFNGIISPLGRKSGGNVHTQGVILITASSPGNKLCTQVADYGWNSHRYSADEANSWIQFDFKNRRVLVTNYTVKSDANEGTRHHLVQWSLDGSNDEESWSSLDRRKTDDLNGRSRVKSYACESVESQGRFFRFIRLTQTGSNSNGDNHLRLANLEFFGGFQE